MASNEDCASVLEQFMHDAANLPAEVSHMMEEIQAKDREMQKCLQIIHGKESNLQKHLKMNGVVAPHPKEAEYSDVLRKNYELCAELQAQKVALSDKACILLDRQIKKFDVKIRELQNDGQLLDGPPLPSIFNRKAESQKPFADVALQTPLQNASISALNASANRLSAQMTAAALQQPLRQVPQMASLAAPAARASVPNTPTNGVPQPHRQKERELSLGADTKRRKLVNPLVGTNLPAQPSSLRQSSIGPSTPKAGTPLGVSGSRAGSLPRTTSAVQTTLPTKKSGLSKKVISHQQINKLKKKHTKHARLSTSGRKKGQSPSVRGGRGGTIASEDADSVLSSADPSDTDASQNRSRRGNKKTQAAITADDGDVVMGEEEEIEEEGDEDDKRYCFCNQRSYGEMVACENDDCPYQWFHTGCLNMKKIPDEDEDWYCPHCREKSEIQEKIRMKKKPGRK